MSTATVLFAMLKADFLERTRRYAFLVTLFMVIYLGYAVNTGQVLIQLEEYRGVYNSAWVGSLMALVITFFLGIFGFYLVKNTIERDERSGVGQILATTPLTRPQYLLGKWLSNFAVLATLVLILALAALVMQMIQREAAQIQVWSLMAPFLFVALPMMALVAAFAVFFETVSWLKGGFGNLVYFFVFIAIIMAGIFLTEAPWLDVTGFSLVGASMKAAAKAAFPTYDNSFLLGMTERTTLATFVYQGVNWTAGLILQRLLWIGVSIGVALLGAIFFNRFDPNNRSISRPNRKRKTSAQSLTEESVVNEGSVKVTQLTPLASSRFHFNFLRLAWLECLLLVKGLKWYWLAGMAVLWIGSMVSPSENMRKYWYMMIAIWPVLIWSKMGEREIRYQAEQLVFNAAYPLVRLVASAWLAGVLMTAAAASGVLLGRLFFGEPLSLLTWILSVVFIPTLALALGILSRGSKLFEVVYPILWYLGPFNVQNQLSVLDYLGIHVDAPVNTAPLLFGGFILLMLALAFIGRKWQMTK